MENNHNGYLDGLHFDGSLLFFNNINKLDFNN